MFCLVYASAGVSNWSPEEVQDMLIGFGERTPRSTSQGCSFIQTVVSFKPLRGMKRSYEICTPPLLVTIATSKSRSSLNSLLRLGVSQIGRWV